MLSTSVECTVFRVVYYYATRRRTWTLALNAASSQYEDMRISRDGDGNINIMGARKLNLEYKRK